MAGCRYQSWLMPYHDGEMPRERRKELEGHLFECPHCAAELKELRALSGLLSEAQVAIPEGMVGRLHDAVASARDRSIVRIYRVAAMAAAAVLVACGTWFWHGRLNGGPEARTPVAWEMAAVTHDPETAVDALPDTVALWMANDLSQENGL